ncbi:MAG: autotransporter-associated beta strand repeat-containing protein, partial [Chthoniobacterales bacterium]
GLGSTGSFLVGSNPTTASAAQGSASTVTLADTNTITAGTFAVGSASTNNQVSTDGPTTLYLGRSNTINATTVYVGHGAASTVNGTMKFDPDVLASSPTATFRGTAGTSTAVTTFYVGVNTTNSSASQTGVVDFTGGLVDAIITTLLVGGSITNFPTAKAQGTLSMDAGTITATTTGIGQASGLSATSTTFGILNVAGGTFTTTNLLLANHNYGAASTAPVTGTVNISGTGAVTVSSASGIVMGQHTNAANSAAVTATINITGGSLTVSGNIAEGTNPTGVTSSLNLDGGTLEMNSKAISVDTFTAASGTLRNLGQLNSGGTFTKTTSGTLILAGTNTYTGSTAINGGTLLVSGTHTGGGSYSINNLGTLSGSGTITTAGNAGVSLLAGGKLAPGSTSSGLKLDLGTGSLDISGGVTSAASQSLLFTLGTVSDKISMTNASSVLNIGSGVLNFDDFVFSQGTGFAAGDYTLFDTGNTIVGTLGSNLTGTVGGFGATLHFGNSNQDVIITLAVPEPSQMAFLCMSGVCFLVWRSRRKLATRLAVKFQDS